MATIDGSTVGRSRDRAAFPEAPLPRSWWVNDHLLAGAYPGAQTPGEGTQKVGALIRAGVTLFLDLTTDQDHLEKYEPYIPELDRSRQIRRYALPIADVTAPTVAVVDRALKLIDAETESGGITYVHCWGGIGRTGSIIGCYLARDIGGAAALAGLKELRQGSTDAHRTAPETEAQRALVRNWPVTKRQKASPLSGHPVAATLAATEIGLPLVRGGLTLFPLFSDLRPAPGYLTGPEAATAQLLVADELASGAVVPELEIHNQAGDTILLIDGETFLGADQNRCLDVSVLCPASSVTAVAVSCVEAGRWGSHRPMTRSTRLTPAALRSRNRSAVGHAVRSGEEPRGNQGRVWEDVSAYMQRLQVEAPTAAMEDVHRSAETTVSKLLDGTAPLKGQRGVAAYVGGDLLAIDLFDTATTMAAYWEGLVGGYALDAIGRSPVDVRRRQVRSVFGSIAAAPPVQAPSKGLGESLHMLTETVTVTALCQSGIVVHLAAGSLTVNAQ